MEYDITDHLPNFCTIDLGSVVTKSNKIKIETRPYSDRNFQTFCSKLSDVDWDAFLNFDEVNECMERFIEKINDL